MVKWLLLDKEWMSLDLLEFQKFQFALTIDCCRFVLFASHPRSQITWISQVVRLRWEFVDAQQQFHIHYHLLMNQQT